ncbi:hypothetical protein EOA60_08175 [Mesorhizobium sp. M1A.F.Ca.IN.020.06.1.1]|nr:MULTISPECIES: hypothetical protein [unclassified Mesorhizobium]RUW33167.1 hypothetical protein EOA60_08175 [Mesorhizobium sp. M1A.F.Ca.IN.020.06.1.1]TIN15579.1 MAG: hypothetical protein E5Y51_17850 [Mesorhizobium sp.]TIR98691.1 MAG: hypothetical protein E5X19_05955 [Mesorhizobium sp.]TIS95999.1 MAG: hypothetical protein E5W99_04115 [Mesorhizobium sp.]
MLLHDHISMLQRLVRHGEWHIARQRERIARLRSQNLPTADALRFLSLLEEVHAFRRKHLSRLLSKPTGSQAGSVFSAKTQLISIPEPVLRLGLELEEALKEIFSGSAAKPAKGRLH